MNEQFEWKENVIRHKWFHSYFPSCKLGSGAWQVMLYNPNNHMYNMGIMSDKSDCEATVTLTQIV